MNKKAQVTIFIILAIVLIAVIGAIYLISSGKNILDVFSPKASDNPNSYLKSCVEKSIRESEELIFLSNGFSIVDKKTSVLYKSQEVPFMCISYEYYYQCVPQEPMFIEKQRKKIENKLAIDLESCISSFRKSMDKKLEIVGKNQSSAIISFSDTGIIADIDTGLIITSEEYSAGLKKIKVEYSSKLFKFLKLAQTITNYESTFCEFNHMSWMAQDHSIIIDKDVLSDQTKIYTLTDRNNRDKKLNFAIKTCVMPAGL